MQRRCGAQNLALEEGQGVYGAVGVDLAEVDRCGARPSSRLGWLRHQSVRQL
jgi:hypothetical protein